MKRWILFAGILGGALALTSCGLLPEEEIFSTAPLVATYEKEEFQQAFAVRGDMQLIKNVSCTYVPVQTEFLSYPVSGEEFDETYVQVGDTVTKGQLLAQLDLSGALEAIENCNVQISKLEKQIAALEENRTLALERQTLLLNDKTEEERNEALAAINKQYDAQKQPMQDNLTIAYLQLKEAKALRDQRQLRAGIDGTITYIRKVETHERSVAGEWFINIADTTTSLFRAETKLWSYFKPGDEHIITVGQNEYETVVVSETELGLEETEKKDGESAFVYLQLKNPAFDLEKQEKGSLILTLDSRKNVLMVPENAVTSANGQSIVYFQNENGLKEYKQVETGLAADGMVEIVSGLTEGESLIVE